MPFEFDHLPSEAYNPAADRKGRPRCAIHAVLFWEPSLNESSLTGTAALFAARGHEAYVADLQTQGRQARPPLPPGVTEIRISSNENPLGPGKTVLDAIIGKFPEAGRYPFNSTPADSALVAGDRREVQGQDRRTSSSAPDRRRS